MKNAIHKFVTRVQTAKHAWETSGGDHHSWLNYFEEKSDAYDEIRQVYPELSYIEHIWTWLYSLPPACWALLLRERIDNIKKGIPCLDCSETIKWPALRCEECAKQHKKDLEEKRQIKKRLSRKKKR